MGWISVPSASVSATWDLACIQALTILTCERGGSVFLLGPR